MSDSIAAPFSWELTAGENPAYPHTGESCYLIGGTHGSLTLPYLDLWQHGATRSWWEPIAKDRVPYEPEDPLALQVAQFAAVIRGKAAPLVSGREGLNTLKVIEAVKESAASGGTVHLA